MMLDTTFQQIGRGQRRGTAYAVYFESQFVGYVVSSDGWWDHQPTMNESEPVQSSPAFTFHSPTRRAAAESLIEKYDPCKECGNLIDPADPHAGHGMCASCLHDALRSGWTPGGDS